MELSNFKVEESTELAVLNEIDLDDDTEDLTIVDDKDLEEEM